MSDLDSAFRRAHRSAVHVFAGPDEATREAADALAERLRAGRPGAVVVEGPEGAGRLTAAERVAWVVEHRVPDLAVVRLDLAGAAPMTAEGLAEQLEASGLGDVLPASEAALSWVAAHGPPLLKLARVVAAAGGEGDAGPGADALPPEVMAERVASAAARRPLLLVVAGLADDPSARWAHLLDDLLTRAVERDVPLGVVAVTGAARGQLADAVAAWERAALVRRVAAERLDGLDALREALDRALGGAAHLAEALDPLVLGDPGALGVVLDDLASRGHLARREGPGGAGAWALDEAALRDADADAADPIQAAAGFARLASAAAPPEARRLARDVVLTGSLFGETFPIHAVLDALGRAGSGDEADDAIDAVDELAADRAGLVEDTEGEHVFKPLVAYRFASPAAWRFAAGLLLREVTPEERARRARALADHLERSMVAGASLGAARAMVRLWEAAGDDDRADRWQVLVDWHLAMAGSPLFVASVRRRLRVDGDPDPAGLARLRTIVGRLLALLDRTPDFHTRQALSLSGAVQALAGRTPLHAELAEALLHEARAWRQVDRAAEALRAARAARRHALAAGGSGHAAVAELGAVRRAAGRPRAAVRLLEAAAELAEAAGDGAAAARHRMAAAEVRWAAGEREAGEAALTRAIATLEAAGEREAAGDARLLLAERLLLDGELAAFDERAREARGWCERAGLLRRVAALDQLRASAALGRGDVSAAAALVRSARAAFQHAGDAEGQAACLHRLALVELDAGRAGPAAELLEEALLGAQQVGAALVQADVFLAFGRLLRRQGELDQVTHLLDAARQGYEHVGSAAGQAAVRLERGRALIAARARQHAVLEREAAKQLAADAPGVAGEAMRTLVRAVEERPADPARAVALMGQARELFARAGDWNHVFAVDERLRELGAPAAAAGEGDEG